MAGEFSLRSLWNKATQVPGKVLDYGSDVLKGAGTLLQSDSVNNAMSTATAGAMAAADTNKDGTVSGFEMLKTGFTGFPKLALDAMANIGDPTRGQPTTSVDGTKTGANVSSSFPTVSLDKMPVQAMPISGVAQSAVSGVAGPITNQPKATPPTTTISGIMGLGAGIAGAKPMTAQQIYNSAPVMSLAEQNQIKNSAITADFVTNPSSRRISVPTVASRFDGLAAHNAFTKHLDMAKYAGELSPSAAYEDAQWKKKLAETASKSVR